MELIFNLDQINDAARDFLAATAPYKVIAFRAEMGSGKTTFIHALCEVLGVQDTVSSPTFSIINQYKTATGQTICHLDLYRIGNEQEAIAAGVEDVLYSGDTCFVEWPEKAPAVLPPDTLYVSIRTAGMNTRKLEINL